MVRALGVVLRRTAVGHNQRSVGLQIYASYSGSRYSRAGFIGSHLCDRLQQSDSQVSCVDNFYLGRQRYKRSGVYTFLGNIGLSAATVLKRIEMATVASLNSTCNCLTNKSILVTGAGGFTTRISCSNG
jgi:hypothetical protein